MSIPAAFQNRQFQSTSAKLFRERWIVVVLALCAATTVLITLGIVGMLVSQSYQFFRSDYVSAGSFLTGTKWTALQSQDLSKAEFGIWPLLSGTLRVTVIAMVLS